MASVRKRKWTHNGVDKEAWVVQYTKPNGKPGIKTFQKKKEADAFRDKEAIQIQRGELISVQDSVTVEFVANEWLKECERRNKSGNLSGYTLNSYRYQATHNIIPSLGSFKITSIQRQQLQELLHDLSKNMKRRSIENTVAVLRHIFRLSIRRKWLARSPIADDPLLIPGRPTGQISIPSKEELRKVLEVLAKGRLSGQQWHSQHIRVCSIMLALFGGMRRGEICGLRWMDVDFNNDVIRVRHSYLRFGLKEPKTQAGIRDIPMAPPLKAALLQAQEARQARAEQFVIMSRVGTPIEPETIYTQYWRPVMVEADLCDSKGTPKYHFHALRHAAASMLIEQGLPPVHVSRFIGHSKVSTTLDIYGHVFPESEASRYAVLRFEAQLEATRTRQEAISH